MAARGRPASRKALAISLQVAPATLTAPRSPCPGAKGEDTKPQVTVCEAHLRLPDFCSSLSQDFIPTLEEIEEFLQEKAEYLKNEAHELHPAGGKVEIKSEISLGSSGGQPVSSVVQEDVSSVQPGGTADGSDQAVATGSIPVVLQIQPLQMDSGSPLATGGVRVAQLVISLQGQNLSLLPQVQPPVTITDQKYIKIAPLPVAMRPGAPGDVQEVEATPKYQNPPPLPSSASISARTRAAARCTPRPPTSRLTFVGTPVRNPTLVLGPTVAGGKWGPRGSVRMAVPAKGLPLLAKMQESSWLVEIQDKITSFLSGVNSR